ncbi:aminotransferase class V-fold PLP-dependent enzyme [Salipaludibacillus sp. CUR1]|uniref:aminotransferase class V-fold PLP-dependent enzyme n=1 Tax=Salipaludibacillus sp. CUR1 TaxID=2820003 RepID=UPI001E443D89|nr:aminotransferase class V-fold PLP-dependent enzyme [Salipaludibacillus sp. CUR1]MCE7791727.1 aminotransferase class V-fold PLP-dependent enzyme [Salipaludibacillus sp. CUR1]
MSSHQPENQSLLPVMSMEEAMKKQFKFVKSISRYFDGNSFMSYGDLGLHPQYKRPETTAKAEQVLADFFEAEAAVLVRGSGTGGIRTLLSVLLHPGDTMIIHEAPAYNTTKETLRMLGLKTIKTDFNNLNRLTDFLKNDKTSKEAKVFYIQHARQQPSDNYDIKRVIQLVKDHRPDLTIVTDDNYCAMKTPGIGVEYGADYATFSGFKVLGPEGVGVIAGLEKGIKTVRERNYSGGGQVQGFEALDLLRMMTLAPVSLAVQNAQVTELYKKLKGGGLSGVESVQLTNAQSKNVLLTFKEPVAKEVIEASVAFGAANKPIGAESKYEILPLIYKPSGSFIESDPRLKDHGIRINPMKSDADHILSILEKALANVKR